MKRAVSREKDICGNVTSYHSLLLSSLPFFSSPHSLEEGPGGREEEGRE